ncbi:MAG TPA: histidine phosphatase family protein [Polyangiaceae bacterium]|nr:histidine phosphatase family protein [Polyangiaceae bacterium]
MLYIIRHAIAVPRTETLSDQARPLTEDGRRRFKRAVRGIVQLGLEFDRLLHSPWLRAVQTADLLSELVRGESQVTELLAMAPSEQLLEALVGERVAVVGHEPWLSELAAWLTLGDPGRASMFILKKGGVIWLEGECAPGQMRLSAALPPKVLRSAAGG